MWFSVGPWDGDFEWGNGGAGEIADARTVYVRSSRTRGTGGVVLIQCCRRYNDGICETRLAVAITCRYC